MWQDYTVLWGVERMYDDVKLWCFVVLVVVSVVGGAGVGREGAIYLKVNMRN